MKISGEVKYSDSAGRRHKVEGFKSLPDEVALQSLNVSGELTFGKISCKTIKISGGCYGDSLTAKTLFVEGTLKVDSVNVEGTLKIEGSLKVPHIEAEIISIESRSGSIGELKCRQITIFHNEDVIDSYNSRVNVKSIDAETVHLENCAVDVIRCKNAFIGSNCAIEKLFVAGEFEVANDSMISETILT